MGSESVQAGPSGSQLKSHRHGISQEIRSFQPLPDEARSGNITRVFFTEFRGVGVPSLAIGRIGDIYIDLTPGGHELYARFPEKWKKWPGPISKQEANLVSHPQYPDRALWCSVKKSSLGWFIKTNIRRKHGSSAGNVITMLLKAQSNRQQDESKKRKILDSPSGDSLSVKKAKLPEAAIPRPVSPQMTGACQAPAQVAPSVINGVFRSSLWQPYSQWQPYYQRPPYPSPEGHGTTESQHPLTKPPTPANKSHEHTLPELTTPSEKPPPATPAQATVPPQALNAGSPITDAQLPLPIPTLMATDLPFRTSSLGEIEPRKPALVPDTLLNDSPVLTAPDVTSSPTELTCGARIEELGTAGKIFGLRESISFHKLLEDMKLLREENFNLQTRRMESLTRSSVDIQELWKELEGLREENRRLHHLLSSSSPLQENHPEGTLSCTESSSVQPCEESGCPNNGDPVTTDSEDPQGAGDNTPSQSGTIDDVPADDALIGIHPSNHDTEALAIQEETAHDGPLLLSSRRSMSVPSSSAVEVVKLPIDGDCPNVDDDVVMGQEDPPLINSAGVKSIPIGIDTTMADGDLHMVRKEDHVPSFSSAPSVSSAVFDHAPVDTVPKKDADVINDSTIDVHRSSPIDYDVASNLDLEQTVSGIDLSGGDLGGQSSPDLDVQGCSDMSVGDHVDEPEEGGEISNIGDDTLVHGHSQKDSGSSSYLTPAKQSSETKMGSSSGSPKPRSSSLSAVATTLPILTCPGEVAESPSARKEDAPCDTETRADELSATIGHGESSAQVDVKVKQEDDESILVVNAVSSWSNRLNRSHLNIIYHTAKTGETYCRLCLQKKPIRIVEFAPKASLEDLANHCEGEHVDTCEQLLCLSPQQLDDIDQCVNMGTNR